MKRKNKKVFIILGGTAAFLLISGLLFYKIYGKRLDNVTKYEIVTLKKSDPLLFNGVVQPKNTSNFNFDQSLGKISNISVQNSQEINENDVIATYQNTTIEDQADEQIQALEKLNLAVVNAQITYDMAIKKQQELVNRLTTSKNERVSVANKEIIDEQKEIELTEIDNKIEAAQQVLDGQEDVVLQAKQGLDSANIDLSSANNSIEKTQKKVTTIITAPFKGIVYVNEMGKVDNTISYATIVSPETVIKGTVSEYDYSKIAENQLVDIQLINEKKVIKGTITNINELPETDGGNQINSSTRETMVSNFSFIVIPNVPLHYGFNVQISVPTNDLELSKRAVIKEKGNTVVFIYKNGKSYKHTVQLDEKDTTYLVKSGLKENDQVLLNPSLTLKDGEEVMVE